MANCCVTYLFFSYAAATIIYFIIGIFAATGNIALLVEHYKFSNATYLDEEEKSDVKSRTLRQYFMSSGLAAFISVPLFVFCIIKKPKGYSDIIQEQNINKKNNKMQIEEEDEEDFNPNNRRSGVMPIEMASGTKAINESDSNTEESGMKENII